MSVDIKIFVSCHRHGVRVPEIPLLVPMHVGAALAEGEIPGLVRDDSGDNISLKNKSYCELTAQYWAWKNADADYYGFLHYRRYFNFSNKEYPIHHEPFIFGDVVFDSNDEATLRKICFNESAIRETIEKYDFISPEPIETPDGVDVYTQYKLSTGHHISDLDTVLDIISVDYPEIFPSARRYLSQNKVFACNMFVMKKDIFFDYCNFLFDVLQKFDAVTDISHYTAIGRRVDGYLAERICGIYLSYLFDSGMNGKKLQRVYFRNADVHRGPTGKSDAAESIEDFKFGSTIRGDGKIYLTVDGVNQNVDGVKLQSKNTSADGAHLPSKILNYNNQQILVLPIMDIDQHVVVTSEPTAGGAILKGSITVSPLAARLHGYANTISRNSRANRIRNFDRRALRGDVSVKVIRIIDDYSVGGAPDGYIIQGSAMYVIDAAKANSEFVEVVAIDGHGNTLSEGDWVCLSDENKILEQYPEYTERKIFFSVKIPARVEFTLWVRFTDRSYLAGFCCVTKPVFDTLHKSWASTTLSASHDKKYEEWFLDKHRVTPLELSMQRKSQFEYFPMFSIVVPLYETPIAFLREMVDSVANQSYANFQLILVNASPEDKELKNLALKYAGSDKRINYIELGENHGITENTNIGIDHAAGDFICFLDHDDVLELDALYQYARCLNDNPEIDMIYCDEDKLNHGHFCAPFFKPDWNPDLLLAENYVCHFLAVRASIAKSLEPASRKYDGSQDYHMTLRVGEVARCVKHVPRVLYHWRIHNNSTAKDPSQKDYTLGSSKLAVQTHLERMGVKGNVAESPIAPRRFIVEYDCTSCPLVSIIIPNKDAVKVLHRCLSSILHKSTYDNFEIIVVENNSVQRSTFEYYKWITKLDARVRVVAINDMESFNYSRLNNFGVSEASGEYLLLLNNDTKVITPNWIEQLVGLCMRDGTGVVGAKLLFPDNTVQHAGINFQPDGPGHVNYLLASNDPGESECAILTRDIAAVTGACLMTSKENYLGIGGMSEEFAVNYNDVDFCLKTVESGKRVVYCPTVQLIHYESVSRGSQKSGSKALKHRREKALFMTKWAEYSEYGGPFRNPNFSANSSYFKLNWEIPTLPWD